MDFNINKSLEILEKTPEVIEKLLSELSPEWIVNNEGADSWSPYDIVGHLIHGEKTDWVQRTKIILSETGSKNFVPFDRFAQFTESQEKSLNDLVSEFKKIRSENLAYIRSLEINNDMLDKKAVHPSFGEVTLRQLLSAWTVHDLAHIAQIAGVMAKQYKAAVGPWIEYFRVLE